MFIIPCQKEDDGQGWIESVPAYYSRLSWLQSYEIKYPPWTILWFRILGIFSVESIKRLCVVCFKLEIIVRYWWIVFFFLLFCVHFAHRIQALIPRHGHKITKCKNLHYKHMNCSWVFHWKRIKTFKFSFYFDWIYESTIPCSQLVKDGAPYLHFLATVQKMG